VGRSVVTKASLRCTGCAQIPRWCICDAMKQLPLPLELAVLIHHTEFYKPTSTGKLIQRIFPSSDLILFKHDLPLPDSRLLGHDKELLILHPFGDPLLVSDDLSQKRFLLLDGNWSQAAGMLKRFEALGRKVSLPMEGDSRFWLREKQAGTRYSTIEALIFLLKHLQHHELAAECQVIFERHVHAGLLARGKKDLAAEYWIGMPKI
jgi:DTW domain-containing protein YfiP